MLVSRILTKRTRRYTIAAVPPYHGAQLRIGLYGLDKRL